MEIDGRVVRFAFDHRCNGHKCLLLGCRETIVGRYDEDEFRDNWWTMREHHRYLGGYPYFTDPVPENYDPATMPWPQRDIFGE